MKLKKRKTLLRNINKTRVKFYRIQEKLKDPYYDIFDFHQDMNDYTQCGLCLNHKLPRYNCNTNCNCSINCPGGSPEKKGSDCRYIIDSTERIIRKRCFEDWKKSAKRLCKFALKKLNEYEEKRL